MSWWADDTGTYDYDEDYDAPLPPEPGPGEYVNCLQPGCCGHRGCDCCGTCRRKLAPAPVFALARLPMLDLRARYETVCMDGPGRRIDAASRAQLSREQLVAAILDAGGQ